MLTPQTIIEYIKAEPFRPFRVHMGSGRRFDIRHTELVKMLKSYLLVFSMTSDTRDLPDRWESVSLMLAESISHLDAAVT
jgi:hypothetical protein